MLNTIKKQIEEKRNSTSPVFRAIRLCKDFFWITREVIKKPSAKTIQRIKRSIIIEKVKEKKRTRKKEGFTYNDHPKLSLILLSFNHKDNISTIIERIRLTGAEEIIICEDGSIDGSREEWSKYLTRPNDFIIQSNDIHEIRAYQKAIGFASGDIVCVLQDDDIPPEDGKWVDQALKLFTKYPELGILGGYRGAKYRLSGSDLVRNRLGYRSNDIPFSEPDLEIPFMFIDAVTIGPVFFRKNELIRIGGFDLNYSKAGEPGIGFDAETSFRAWSNGLQVGLYTPAFRRRVGEQGTIVFGGTERDSNFLKNYRAVANTYGTAFTHVRKRVDELNNRLLKPVSAQQQKNGIKMKEQSMYIGEEKVVGSDEQKNEPS